jgi:prepilin-type N-terminal cleavage/methylation domain-containing protein/prepilin-type processing-associated H-X9-DG protein
MRHRTAMSLIELLVVIAILAVALALLLPAVQAVRGSVARADCSNRLRQLALAFEQYHGARGQLPPGFVSDAQPKNEPYTGWPARLLPYLEQYATRTRIRAAFVGDPNPLTFYGHPPHAELLATVVPAFVCPADDRVRQPHRFDTGAVAFTSYLGVSGTSYLKKNGVLFADSRVRWAEVTDGLSNTLLVGERPPSADYRLGWWYRGWGLYQDGTGEMVLGVRERNFSSDYPNCRPGPYTFVAGRLSEECDLFHFWSMHRGGGNFALCDGSVRFIRYGANEVMPALATRAGGEVATVPD